MTIAHNGARFASLSGLALCLCIVAVLVASPAHAVIETAGFEVSFCEKEMVLEHPDEMQYMKFSMWDTPYERIRNRSMPWVEVKNLDNSDGNLTEYSMTIGDTDYNFSNAHYGAYAILSDSTPDVLIQSIVSTGDQLTLTFGNGGLAPGETVRFGIDIDPDPNIDGLFPHPDFRLVLFDMNNMDGNGTNDNSEVSAKFEDPNDSSMTAIASTQLPDYQVTGNQGDYYNQFIRPYGVMEGVDIFSDGGLVTNPIPEPSSGVAAILVAALAAGLWRRRRL